MPPPRVNLVRYHGVLAPAARHRAEVVPVVEKPEDLESLEKNADSRSQLADCHTFPGSDSGDPQVSGATGSVEMVLASWTAWRQS